MTSGPPATTRLYDRGKVIEEGFPPERVSELLAAHPEGVLWLDLLDPEQDDLAAYQEQFDLHPLAVEDAVHDHQRPKLDRYPGHLFLNTYAVHVTTDPEPALHKVEISAFITERALLTVHKSAGDVAHWMRRWDADAEQLGADNGVGFLVYGMLDVIVDGQLAAAHRLDEAMDGAEDEMLQEGGASRATRRYGFALRRTLAMLRRGVAPMPELIASVLSAGHLMDERLEPYFRDVDDHARRAAETTESALDRINTLLQDDLNEQSNALNDTTRKLAAWAAIIAVPTAITGFFGQNVPFPGYERHWGVLVSASLIVGTAALLFYVFKRQDWL